ncbi:hypothetical protein N24_0467 [Corynebacterium suranareeae]|uniref:Uncharacterized protein n=1 Tax=Corynebacterium suranareeae TaxID=2506452 RepID=A0A160PLZ9_9CORY|nr:hypothetical protein [Corynebacterium suranareeae]BAU94729.1 hypothetical protein N24_0467 [Corynebacterium suranareeae]
MGLHSPDELQKEAKEFVCQWDKVSFKRFVKDDEALKKNSQVEIDAVYSVSETVFLFKLDVNITRPTSLEEFTLLVGYEYEKEISPSHQESIDLVVEKLGPIAFEILNQEVVRLGAYSMESPARISIRDQANFWEYFCNQPEEEISMRSRALN